MLGKYTIQLVGTEKVRGCLKEKPTSYKVLVCCSNLTFQDKSTLLCFVSLHKSN